MNKAKLSDDHIAGAIAASMIDSLGNDLGAERLSVVMMKAALKLAEDATDKHKAWLQLQKVADLAADNARRLAHPGPWGVS
ncbi:hypothetical protein EWE75_04235 [Sphingomonas populi]|uniref:Uncharacterized protein n=1 Tax=Sphingomonas populi TaxID=2484750 RepID=A0A4Q6Y8B9_9SPHN|nr:hypothetical protein [Sphingomonas populi]RZF65867.1 hypothetical protein EWE75_04235 [Sphingomonas populi]